MGGMLKELVMAPKAGKVHRLAADVISDGQLAFSSWEDPEGPAAVC